MFTPFILIILVFICLAAGVLVFFFCRWVAGKLFKEQTGRRITAWIATIVLTLLLWFAVAVGLLVAGADTYYPFDAGRWSRSAQRSRMVYDLMASDTLRGMTHAEVRQLLGKPDQDDRDSVWIYSLNRKEDEMLEVKFRNGRVTAVESPWEVKSYEDQ